MMAKRAAKVDSEGLVGEWWWMGRHYTGDGGIGKKKDGNYYYSEGGEHPQRRMAETVKSIMRRRARENLIKMHNADKQRSTTVMLK
jgi:hypothetical protein